MDNPMFKAVNASFNSMFSGIVDANGRKASNSNASSRVGNVHCRMADSKLERETILGFRDEGRE